MGVGVMVTATVGCIVGLAVIEGVGWVGGSVATGVGAMAIGGGAAVGTGVGVGGGDVGVGVGGGTVGVRVTTATGGCVGIGVGRGVGTGEGVGVGGTCVGCGVQLRREAGWGLESGRVLAEAVSAWVWVQEWGLVSVSPPLAGSTVSWSVWASESAHALALERVCLRQWEWEWVQPYLCRRVS